MKRTLKCKRMHWELHVFLQQLLCVMSAVMPACEQLQYTGKTKKKKAKTLYMLGREQRISLILSPFLLRPVSARRHAFITADVSLFSVGFIIRRTETNINPSKCRVAFTVRRQIKGAHFNASQSSLRRLCGNLAAPTHYLEKNKTPGPLSGSGTERSLHTSSQPSRQLISSQG